MDELLDRRLQALQESLEALRDDQAGLRQAYVEHGADLAAQLANFQSEVRDAHRNLELRLSTEVRETAALVRDLKAWLQDRDDTRARLQKLEEQVQVLLAAKRGA
jgi:chromosome segregation ATPase